MLLNEFGERLRDIFGEVAYQVGSSLGGKTSGWRDVDVRLLLDDKQWEAMALGDPQNPHGNRKWRALCIVLSDYGRRLTGLPIDFQLQQRSHANAEYGRAKGCVRSALIVLDRDAEEAAEDPIAFMERALDAPDKRPAFPEGELFSPPEEATELRAHEATGEECCVSHEIGGQCQRCKHCGFWVRPHKMNEFCEAHPASALPMSRSQTVEK